MPEATMICCDTSEWMRNGDFTPNRFDSQKDALSIICSAKTEQNHENTVGLIGMGKDEKAEVFVNCTNNVGRILQQAHKMKIDGRANILVALQTAQLALKHRKNKKQTQRIIVFVGSPVNVSKKLLTKAGKRLKKNNVAVDIVNFGETEENKPILESFLKSVNSSNNSHLINIEPNSDVLLSDILISSPLLQQQQQVDDLTGQVNPSQPVIPNQGGGGGGGGVEEINGIRRDQDPELYEAIMQSLREEEQRLQRNVQESSDNNENEEQQPQEQPQQGGDGGGGGGDDNQGNLENMDIDDNDEELMRALQMSMQEMQEEEQQQEEEPQQGQEEQGQQEDTQIEVEDLDDGDLLNELIDGLPGLNEDDVDVDELLGNMDDDESGKKDESKKKDKEYKD